jgi:ssDNA-binding Zn-finger/Zn-ribbon topoisomerase 1
MLERLNQRTGLPFWGCSAYPKCRGTRPSAREPEPPDSPRSLAQFRAMLHEVSRERDALRAQHEHLLGELQRLREPRPPALDEGPGPVRETLVMELTRLLSVVHPDKWGGESAVAKALTQEVLALRAKLQEGRR